MEEAGDLFPADALADVLEVLRQFRLAGAHGHIQLNIQHGRIAGIGQYKSKKYPFGEKNKKSPR